MVSIGGSTAAAEKLTAYLERIEHLFEEIDGLKDDLQDLKAQARDEGFNVAAALVRLVAIRRSKRRASQENELLNDLVLYAHATGTPLDFGFVDGDSIGGDPTEIPPLASATAPASRVTASE